MYGVKATEKWNCGPQYWFYVKAGFEKYQMWCIPRYLALRERFINWILWSISILPHWWQCGIHFWQVVSSYSIYMCRELFGWQKEKENDNLQPIWWCLVRERHWIYQSQHIYLDKWIRLIISKFILVKWKQTCI